MLFMIFVSTIGSWIEEYKVIYDNFCRLSWVARSIIPLSCFLAAFVRRFFAIGEVLDQNITIIALTASVMREDHDRCINAGMDRVEPKPIEFESKGKTADPR